MKKNLLLLLLVGTFFTACEDDEDPHHHHGDYMVTIDIQSPGAGSQFTNGDSLHIHVNFTNDDVIHYVQVIVENASTGEEIYNEQEHAHADLSMTYHDHVELSATETGDYVLRALSWPHDSDEHKITEEVMFQVN